MLRKPLEEAPVRTPDADLGNSVIKVTRKLKKMPSPPLLPPVALPVKGEEESSSEEEAAPVTVPSRRKLKAAEPAREEAPVPAAPAAPAAAKKKKNLFPKRLGFNTDFQDYEDGAGIEVLYNTSDIKNILTLAHRGKTVASISKSTGFSKGEVAQIIFDHMEPNRPEGVERGMFVDDAGLREGLDAREREAAE